MLARESCHREVVAAGEGLKVTARPRLEQANALVALAAGPIAALVTEEQATLVRSCAGADCSLWFLDRTKSHRRLFCSAAVCGGVQAQPATAPVTSTVAIESRRWISGSNA